MRVDSWFDDFAIAHVERCPRGEEWPGMDSHFWDVWRTAFITDGITAEVADQASRIVAMKPPRFLDGHLEALRDCARTVFDRLRFAEADVPADRKEAESRSRGCQECAGGGLTFRRVMIRRRDREPIVAPVSCYCHRCVMGRWMKSAHEKDDSVRGRILDLADRPDLWGDEEPAETPMEAAR